MNIWNLKARMSIVVLHLKILLEKQLIKKEFQKFLMLECKSISHLILFNRELQNEIAQGILLILL